MSDICIELRFDWFEFVQRRVSFKKKKPFYYDFFSYIKLYMNRRFHYSFIPLIEPFQASEEIQHYKNKIGFDHAVTNCSGKIWLF